MHVNFVRCILTSFPYYIYTQVVLGQIKVA